MKFNKKGFTLIELLAVIAILAILMVIAVPAVLDLFNSSKESAFRTQAQTIFKAAEQKMISDALDPTKTPSDVYTNATITGVTKNELPLSGGVSVEYYVKVNTATSTITCIVIKDTSYKVIEKTTPTVVKLKSSTLLTGASNTAIAVANCQ